MNLITAWKTATIGQRLVRSAWDADKRRCFGVRKSNLTFSDTLAYDSHVTEEDRMAEEWIVEEEKMNLIKAWKAAKEGQKISRQGNRSVCVEKERVCILANFIMLISTDDLFADDWEVVKQKRERKVMVWQLRKESQSGFLSGVPDEAVATITWGE